MRRAISKDYQVASVNRGFCTNPKGYLRLLK